MAEQFTTLISNAQTGKTTIRDLTADEISQREAEAKTEKAQVKKQEAEAQAKADARISALAKLSALGLTPQEIESL